MARRWALSLWFASALALSGCDARQPQETRLLTEQEARDAQFVAQWLQKNGTEDRKEAQQFFQQALLEKQRQNWSAAAKAFGESMIRYPSPQALAGYADADLQMLASVRARDRNAQEHAKADTAHALEFYRAALSADAVLKTLPVQEKDRILRNADCLAAYAASGTSVADCQPLEDYFRPR